MAAGCTLHVHDKEKDWEGSVGLQTCLVRTAKQSSCLYAKQASYLEQFPALSLATTIFTTIYNQQSELVPSCKKES